MCLVTRAEVLLLLLRGCQTKVTGLTVVRPNNKQAVWTGPIDCQMFARGFTIGEERMGKTKLTKKGKKDQLEVEARLCQYE